MRVGRVTLLLLCLVLALPPVAAQAAAHPVVSPHSGAIPAGGLRAAKGTGNTIGTTIYEARPRADGYRHINTPATIAKLKAMGLNTYLYDIWVSPKDWDDLRLEFAPAARAAGLNIWIYLAPPSECLLDPPGNCPRPYLMDFKSWAREIAKLSVQYPNVTAWAIDDFFSSDANKKLFTHDYLTDLRTISHAINPNLGFYTTFYLWNAVNDDELTTISGVVDGIIFPYLGSGGWNTQDPSYVTQQMDQILAHTGPKNLELVLLIYAGRLLDAPLPPTEDYVGAVMDRAKPYVDRGWIQGIIDYGAPITDDPQVNSDNIATDGRGRLSFIVPKNTATPTGSYQQASHRITVNPNASSYDLTFSHYDENARVSAVTGYQIKQALIDNTVVWESDIEDDPNYQWADATVGNDKLFPLLHGKTSATLTFRLLERQGVGSFPVDVGFDNVRSHGFTTPDPSFERPHSWTLARTSETLLPSQYVWFADRPVRIRNAIAARWGGTQARVSTGPNSARSLSMYGPGRLQLTVPEKTATSAGMCTSASQQVKVDPRSPRYELSFWSYDNQSSIVAGYNYHYKDVYITNSKGRKLLSRADVQADPAMWMNNQGAWNHIDVTSFLKGESSVTFEFALCDLNGVGDYGVDVGYDNIETIGFAFRNPGFDRPGSWTLTDDGPMHARILVDNGHH
ncbi:hypothetical protein [Fodinicola acaciae]|uniref:hypothetical protein n=1 Tax=Fodinicola acaciae TaxID=2681555 RepID=UPI0013D03D3C|nr:hypothetical protein [Fodinicola acaciae]